MLAENRTGPTSGYDEIEAWIEDQTRQVRQGQIAIVAPEHMRLGQHSSVEVGISTTGLDELLAALHAQPKPKVNQTQVGRFMEVAVSGENFDVALEGDGERLILGDRPTIWTFTVRPQKSGRLMLHIQAFIRLKLPGNTEVRRDLPAVDKVVHVSFDLPSKLNRLWREHWRMPLALGSALGGLVAYVFSLDPVQAWLGELLVPLLEQIRPLT